MPKRLRVKDGKATEVEVSADDVAASQAHYQKQKQVELAAMAARKEARITGAQKIAEAAGLTDEEVKALFR